MTRLPLVTDGMLRGPELRGGVPVGSPDWFAWLTNASTRSFSYRSPTGRFTARREQRQRGGTYWTAYRTSDGRQHKVYLGKADGLTGERLAEAAADLARRITVADGISTAPESDALLPLTVLPVLTPELLVPPPRRGTVIRPRLHGRLRAARDATLTTVVAPAGWGKTTLLSSWANDPDEDRSVGWLSIDEGDNEPVRFWTYALSALHRVAPGIAGNALTAVRASVLDPVNLAISALLNALTGSTDEHVLVLDDYHLLADAVIHESVAFLLDYAPPTLRLVIAGRTDPALPLARMRARGALAEIRVGDLRCTAAEGSAMLAGVTDVTETAADGLVAKTEGWAASPHPSRHRPSSVAPPNGSSLAAMSKGPSRTGSRPGRREWRPSSSAGTSGGSSTAARCRR